jgi:hypothetical protein
VIAQDLFDRRDEEAAFAESFRIEPIDALAYFVQPSTDGFRN